MAVGRGGSSSGRGSRETVLVVGGAGYIGAHTAKALARDFDVVVFDDLSRGHRWAVRWGDLVVGDLSETERLERLLKRRRVAGVFHFAARSLVGESVVDPLSYWRTNVGGTASLLEAVRRAGTPCVVFSSSAATYGEPKQVPIPEDHPTEPVNPYGQTKLAVERMLSDCGEAFGLRSAALRYFNAAGASPDGEVGEDHEPETHLIPLLLDVALGRRPAARIFGDDYPTEDGTCVRDYVHVTDLAEAHVLAFRKLRAGTPRLTLNLGNGRGYSVKQVLAAVRDVTGRPVPCETGARRAGDPARLVASSARAVAELGWRPAHAALDDIVSTAWRWHEGHFGAKASKRRGRPRGSPPCA